MAWWRLVILAPLPLRMSVALDPLLAPVNLGESGDAGLKPVLTLEGLMERLLVLELCNFSLL